MPQLQMMLWLFHASSTVDGLACQTSKSAVQLQKPPWNTRARADKSYLTPFSRTCFCFFLFYFRFLLILFPLQEDVEHETGLTMRPPSHLSGVAVRIMGLFTNLSATDKAPWRCWQHILTRTLPPIQNIMSDKQDLTVGYMDTSF